MQLLRKIYMQYMQLVSVCVCTVCNVHIKNVCGFHRIGYIRYVFEYFLLLLFFFIQFIEPTHIFLIQLFLPCSLQM